MLEIPRHRLKVVLVEPQIAPNTGNIGRLCVASGCELHLVRPLGFVLSDRNLRRSGMDYWPRLKLTVHDDLNAFLKFSQGARMWLFTTKAQRVLWKAEFAADDYLVFGNETQGLPKRLLDQRADQTLCIPQAPNERCLNLSTAAGIAVYEAARQLAAAQRPG